MIPESIVIGCYEYEIIETEDPIISPAKKICYGLIDTDKHTISIAKGDGFSEQTREVTLWHEIFHGIFNYRNIDPAKLDTETLCDELASAIYGICKSNGVLPGQPIQIKEDDDDGG
jgi:Zn-dependent peptidase ImmA (M78 family)